MTMKNESSFNTIESAKDLPLYIRLRDILLTALIWIIYCYFMRDFFAFCVDIVSWMYHGFHNAASYHSFRVLRNFLGYFEVMDILGLLLIFWSVYNLLRYGKKNRRRPSQPVQPEQLAAHHQLDVEDIKTWQEAKHIVMHHNEEGKLVDVVKIA